MIPRRSTGAVNAIIDSEIENRDRSRMTVVLPRPQCSGDVGPVAAVLSGPSASLSVDHPVVRFLSALMLQGYAGLIIETHGFNTVELLLEHIVSEADVAELGIKPLAHVKILLAGLAKERKIAAKSGATSVAAGRRKPGASAAAPAPVPAAVAGPTGRATVVLPDSRFLRSTDFINIGRLAAATTTTAVDLHGGGTVIDLSQITTGSSSSILPSPCPVAFSQSTVMPHSVVQLKMNDDGPDGNNVGGDDLTGHLGNENAFRLAVVKTLGHSAWQVEKLLDDLQHSAEDLIQTYNSRLNRIMSDREAALTALKEAPRHIGLTDVGSEDDRDAVIMSVLDEVMSRTVVQGFAAELNITPLCVGSRARRLEAKPLRDEVAREKEDTAEYCDRGTSPLVLQPCDTRQLEPPRRTDQPAPPSSAPMVISISSRTSSPASSISPYYTQWRSAMDDSNANGDMTIPVAAGASRDGDGDGRRASRESSEVSLLSSSQSHQPVIGFGDGCDGFDDGPSGIDQPADEHYTQNSFYCNSNAGLDDDDHEIRAETTINAMDQRSPSLICSRSPLFEPTNASSLLDRPPLAQRSGHVGNATSRPHHRQQQGPTSVGSAAAAGSTLFPPLSFTLADVELASREELVSLCNQYALATRPIDVRADGDDAQNVTNVDDEDDEDWFREMVEDVSDSDVAGPAGVALSSAPCSQNHSKMVDLSQASSVGSMSSRRTAVSRRLDRADFMRFQLRGLLARREFALVTGPAFFARVPRYSGLPYEKRLRSQSRLQQGVQDALTREELEMCKKRLKSEERAENMICIVASLAHQDACDKRKLVSDPLTYAGADASIATRRVAAFSTTSDLQMTLFESSVLREAVPVEAVLATVNEDFPHVSTNAVEALLAAAGTPMTLAKSSAKAQTRSNWYQAKHRYGRGGGGHHR